jgi:dynein heavy chain
MVFMEPKQLGHQPLIVSYCSDLERIVGKSSEIIKSLMLYLADLCINFTNYHGKFPVPTDPNFLIKSMLNIFDCYVNEWKAEDAKLPKEHEDMCINAVVFAHIWSIGVALDETSRPKFDKFL